MSGLVLNAWRSACAALVLAIVCTAVPGAVSPAAAQGLGWFGNLFGAPPGPLNQPRYPGYNQQPDSYYRHRRAPRRRAFEATRAPREKDTPARDKDPVPAKNASVFVYVLGDSFGQNLASGLEDALVDRQDVAVIHKAKGSSGLVASDFYDWPKVIDDLLAENSKARIATETKAAPGKAEPGKPETTKVEVAKPDAAKSEAAKSEVAKSESAKPEPAASNSAKGNPNRIDVAVMMVGSNDRQPLREGGKMLAVGTPEWTDAYKKRVLGIDEAFRRANVPLIWVGLPITRDDNFADDMAAFNDIYREAAAKTGAVYVDTWEAFSDDDGDFSAVGPDVDGQIVRLRTADGIYFNKAGSRKLAHFVEPHVRRALDGKVPRPTMPDTPTPVSVPVARKPDVGPISSLTDLPAARDGKLAASYRADAGVFQAETDKAHPPSGRADDLRWPAAGVPNP